MENNSNNVELTPNINYIHIIGKVAKEVTPSHLFDGKMHYFFKIEVDSKDKKSNIIQVFVPEELIVSSTNHIFDEGDTVEIEGSLVHTKIEGRMDVSVVADTVELVDSSTKHISIFQLECTIYKSYEIKVNQDGKCTKNIIVRHESSKYENKFFNMKVVTWNSLAKKLDSNYKEGDSIIIKGRFKSREDTSGDKTIYLHEALANIILEKK